MHTYTIICAYINAYINTHWYEHKYTFTLHSCIRAYRHSTHKHPCTYTYKHNYVFIQMHRRCITQTYTILTRVQTHTHKNITSHVHANTRARARAHTHKYIQSTFKHSRKYSHAHLKFDLLGYCLWKFQNVIKFRLSQPNHRIFIKFRPANRFKNYSASRFSSRNLVKWAIVVGKIRLGCLVLCNLAYISYILSVQPRFSRLWPTWK